MSMEIIISLLTALGVGGILAVLLSRHFDQQKQIIEHDVKIFNQSNSILSEQKLSELTNLDLEEEHSINNGDLDLLINWSLFFEQTGNQCIDKRIIKATRKLLEAIDQLINFISFNFSTSPFQNPNDNGRHLYLKPNWNPDRNNQSGSDGMPTEYVVKYKESVKKLKDMTSKVIHQYSEYRLTVKRSLKI